MNAPPSGTYTIKTCVDAGKSKKVTFEEIEGVFYVSPGYVSDPLTVGQKSPAEFEAKTWPTGGDFVSLKTWGAPKQRIGGGGGPAAWKNSKEGFEAEQRMWSEKLRFEQDQMNRRTALMQAVVIRPNVSDEEVLASAARFYEWLAVSREAIATPSDTPRGNAGSTAAAPDRLDGGSASKAPLNPTPSAEDVRTSFDAIGLTKEQHAGFKAACGLRKVKHQNVLVAAHKDGVQDFDTLMQFLAGLPNPTPGPN